MAAKSVRIVVIGASAGGLATLKKLLPTIPAGLPAAFVIVLHMSPDASGADLVESLQAASHLPLSLVRNRQPLRPGRVYIAPPDAHTLVKKGMMLVTKGARENRFRPSIDTLFRSCAVAYGPAAIGVILSGLLDDGTVGMIAIKECGGVGIVQDPGDALYDDMPQSALNHAKIDYRLSVSHMGGTLMELIRAKVPKAKPVPGMLAMEAKIAERVVSDLEAVNRLGSQAPYNCPGCGGILWEIRHGKVKRYRCHVGHAYSGQTLLGAQSEKIEETLWTALRMFEERRNLLLNLAGKEGNGSTPSLHARARETKIHVDRIRTLLMANAVSDASPQRRKTAKRKASTGPAQ